MSMFAVFCDAIIKGEEAEEIGRMMADLKGDLVVIGKVVHDRNEIILHQSVYERLGLDKNIPFSLDDVGAVIANLEKIGMLDIIILILRAQMLHLKQAKAAELLRRALQKKATLEREQQRASIRRAAALSHYRLQRHPRTEGTWIVEDLRLTPGKAVMVGAVAPTKANNLVFIPVFAGAKGEGPLAAINGAVIDVTAPLDQQIASAQAAAIQKAAQKQQAAAAAPVPTPAPAPAPVVEVVNAAVVKAIEWPLTGIYTNAESRQAAFKEIFKSANRPTLEAIRTATAAALKEQKTLNQRPVYTKALVAGLEQVNLHMEERGFLDAPAPSGGQTHGKKDQQHER
ncbi:MAG: hypothetical protein WCJ64_02030 [Rhodospirillaceae bacterium]